ncbi:MAG TPA: indolepyruvate ferredoxin oxidoreductase, partial [Firmicutes bacterium]|nr:indolepyruvate ferredoxin oxidoreductase [Bacillota bacterium]
MNAFAQNLLNKDAWSGLMMGNHALVRAMIEAGTMVVTAYPGSPTPEIAEAIEIIPEDKRPLHFQWCTNEKVALEVAFGASINHHLSTVFFKSVGLNVALDSAVQLSLLDLTGGMVIVIGDDPGANSSQNEQDNRYIARLAGIPMLEPGTPTEVHRMYKSAVELSQRLKMPVLLRLTTHVCHAREVVQFDELPEHSFDWTPRYQAKGLEYWPITANVFPLKRRMLAKLAAVKKEADASPLNEITRGGDSCSRGIITHGLPAYAVYECLDQTSAEVDVLKLGITHPLPAGRVLEFLKSHDEVLVLEELDPILEREIKALAFDEKVGTEIRNRPEVEHLMHEFTPERTWNLLAQVWPGLFEARPAPPEPEEEVSPRLAQMCPGCGHRSAFFAIRELIEEEYENAITVADIGCHSLGSMEPYEMGTVLLCMGHSNGTGAGMSIGNSERPVITFIGDSTFYHAGLPAIINAIMHNHNLTLVV